MTQNTRKYCGSKHWQDFSQISWSKHFRKDSDEDYIAANMTENRIYALSNAPSTIVHRQTDQFTPFMVGTLQGLSKVHQHVTVTILTLLTTTFPHVHQESSASATHGSNMVMDALFAKALPLPAPQNQVL